MEANSDTQHWQRLWEVFEEAVDLPPAERERVLAERCGDDAALRAQVESLLHAESLAARFDLSLDAARRAAAQHWVDESDTAANHPGDRIGPWNLLRELGRGGMGVVWLAERADGQFEQRVALKLIRRGLASDVVHRRFLRERQILARLEHPHIAHLLDGGITDEGSPYFAMEYVEGLPLLQYCQQYAVDLEGRIRIFLDICSAVHFAHEHQVVHRDLKPSNVLVTKNMGVKLLDFGIAKLLDDVGESDTITHLQREQPMTPAYAAPEQIRGGTITTATDIYTLGCVLYELLTGEHAYDFKSAVGSHELLQVIESSDPVAPSRVKAKAPPVSQKRLRGAMDTIVLTALRREPERRYASVAAFAADLQNHLAGRAISARRTNLLYRGFSYLRRHRAVSAALFAVALTAVTALAVDWLERSARATVVVGASLAIVDFHNLSANKDSDWVTPALSEMLATELAQGNRMHALPDELVRPARSDLTAPMAGGYAMQSLATLRKRLGVDYVLSGSYLVSGASGERKLRLDLALQDARTGTAVANVAQSGTLDNLPALVDKAAEGLRAQAGFVSLAPDEIEQTGQARPPSTEVARSMGIALEALHKFDAARAKDELLAVTATVPDYAPAHLYLAQAWSQLGYEAKALASAQRAEANSAGLPEELRTRISREVAVQKSDWNRAIELDRQSLAADENNPELHLAVIDDLTRAGKWPDVDAALAELRKLPGSEDDPRIDIRAAVAAQQRSDPKAQAGFAQSALEKAQARDEAALVAKAEYSLAQAMEALGKPTQAQALFRKTIGEFQFVGNPRGEANAHLELANIADRGNAPQVAREEYENARKIYQRINDAEGLIFVYRNLMLMLWHVGDRDAAEAAAQRVLDLKHETGNPVGEGRILSTIAYMEMDEIATDQVMEKFRQAIAMDERDGAKSAHIYALKNYSEGLRLRGELDAANEVCAKALDDAGKMTDPSLRMVTMEQCAVILLTSGDIDRALALFAEASDIAIGVGDAKKEGEIETELASIDIAKGSYQHARDRLRRAIEKFSSGETITSEAKAQSLLARVLNILNERADSESTAARARELRTRITSRQEVFVVDLALAQLRGESGEVVQARAALHELAIDAERRHWLANSVEAQLALLQLLDRSGDSKAAQVLRRELAEVARQHGFGWISKRLTFG